MYAEMVYQGSRVCDDQKFQQLIGIYVCEKNILLNTNFKRKLFIIVYLYLLFYVCLYNNLKFVNKNLRIKICVNNKTKKREFKFFASVTLGL